MKRIIIIFLSMLLTASFYPVISYAVDKKEEEISRGWNARWNILLENEKAIADLKKLGILQARCVMGKKINLDKSEVARNCKEYKAQSGDIEMEAILRRYVSRQALGILKDEDDTASRFIKDILKKQIDEVEINSPTNQFHPKEWKELVESFESEISSKRKKK